MNTLFHELAPTNDFQFNCRSKSETHFSRYNKIIKSAASSKLEPTKEPNQESSGNDDYSAALKIISDLLMEDDEQEEDHDSLALQATEKSFYDALHNNIPLDQNTLHLGDLLDFQLLSSSDAPSERYIDPFHLNINNYDYFLNHGNDSEQNKYNKTAAAGDCLKMVKKKGNVTETLDDKVLFCINSDLVMPINGESPMI